MYRINKVFENESTILVRIEGSFTSEEQSWSQYLDEMLQEAERNVFIDLSEATFSNEKEMRWLVERMKTNVFLVNSPIPMKDFLRGTPLSGNLLD